MLTRLALPASAGSVAVVSVHPDGQVIRVSGVGDEQLLGGNVPGP